MRTTAALLSTLARPLFWQALGPALGLSLSLWGCSRSKPVEQGGVRIQLSGEPASVDPSLAEDGLALKILSNTAEGLVGYDGAGKLTVRAARTGKISKDGLTYQFELWPDARWSDGVALEAAHFKLGLDRARDPATGARLAELLKPVQSVEAPNPTRLVVRLRTRTPHFMQVLALPIGAPLRKDILDRNGGKWPVVAPSASRFFIESRKPEQSWRIALNPHHRLNTSSIQTSAMPKGIELVMVSDELTAAALFHQGKIDILSKVAQAEQGRLGREGLLHQDPFWATYYLGFNTRSPRLSSAELRCTLSSLIRRDEVVSAMQSPDRPATSWIPPGIEGHVEPKSSSAITEASLKGIPAGLKLTAMFDGNSRNQLVMEKIQSDWRKAGVELALSSMEWKSYLRELQSHVPDVYRLGWLAAFADPVSHLQALTSTNPNNHTGWSHAPYDALVARIEKLEPGPERLHLILEAQKILHQKQCPVVPIYHYVQTHGVSRRIEGFAVNGMGVVRWEELRIK